MKGKKLSVFVITTLFAGSLFSCAVRGEDVKTSLPPLHVYNGGKVIFVSPKGSDLNSGLSPSSPLKHIQTALEVAQPGDTIVLLPGKYRENVHTVRSGKKGKPITIVGTPGSIIYGNNRPKGKVIYVRHSYIHLLQLTINGDFKGCTQENCYHDKLIYVKGSPEHLLKGIRIVSNRVKNALGECIRIKYTENSEVAYNQVSHCGIRDFVYHRGKQNGEGIYVGTAPEQTHGKLDLTNHIYIHHNSIATYGAECVDVKEGTTDIYIYDNICTEEKASHVGGISIRGNRAFVFGNIVFGNEGAGIRFGGDTLSFGGENTAEYNYLVANKFADIKVMNPENTFSNNVKLSRRKVYEVKLKKRDKSK
ncbi:DUF1565 domain-containing protein [Thermovibrio sp.]